MSSIDPNQSNPIRNQPGPAEARAPQGPSFSKVAEPKHQFFPSLHLNKKQQAQFLKNLVKFMSTQLKQEMAHMKKAMEEAKRKIEQGD